MLPDSDSDKYEYIKCTKSAAQLLQIKLLSSTVFIKVWYLSSKISTTQNNDGGR